MRPPFLPPIERPDAKTLKRIEREMHNEGTYRPETPDTDVGYSDVDSINSYNNVEPGDARLFTDDFLDTGAIAAAGGVGPSAATARPTTELPTDDTRAPRASVAIGGGTDLSTAECQTAGGVRPSGIMEPYPDLIPDKKPKGCCSIL